MTDKKNGLTASNIKYLLAMYRLYSDSNAIRCVKIAESLNITKPSVHTMLNTLQKLNLVRKNYRSEVFLTEEGLKKAKQYYAYYGVLHGMFAGVLTDEFDIRSAACAVIAEISEKSLEHICKKQYSKEFSGVE